VVDRPHDPYDAILLVSFGGPEGPDDVIPFLENVTAGRNIPRERLAEVGEQYAHFGGVSPLNEQCRRQQAALESALAEAETPLPVYWGNRNWAPYLTDTVERMAEDGISRALAVFTSAYSSYSGCRQYRENLAAARTTVAERRPDLVVPEIDKVRAYYDHPGFLGPFVDATAAAVAEHGDARPTLVFTAHSIPTSMAAQCDYEIQLREAARLVVGALPDPSLSWSLVWQSRSGPPQVPWLEPDVNDALTALGSEGVRHVVIVPIGFVSDHMEVMWDLDTQAVETAEAAGISLTRAVAPGTDPEPAFITMWVDLIHERIAAERADDRGDVPRAALGSLAVRPDVCAVDCCPAPARPTGRPGGPPGSRG
jgi:ferrochelatase